MKTYLDQLESNKNFNGGGLATNITGRFESNRHAIAKIEKFTFGEVVKALSLKKNGGLKIKATELLEIYRAIFGEPEWHHAGFLPKSYGGGMKKTYFLNEVPSKQEVESWMEKYNVLQAKKAVEKDAEVARQKRREAFIKLRGTRFSRVSEAPRFSVVKYTEMQGKYGWFVEESHHNYSLDRYYTGVSFKSQKSLDQYREI